MLKLYTPLLALVLAFPVVAHAEPLEGAFTIVLDGNVHPIFDLSGSVDFPLEFDTEAPAFGVVIFSIAATGLVQDLRGGITGQGTLTVSDSVNGAWVLPPANPSCTTVGKVRGRTTPGRLAWTRVQATFTCSGSVIPPDTNMLENISFRAKLDVKVDRLAGTAVWKSKISGRLDDGRFSFRDRDDNAPPPPGFAAPPDWRLDFDLAKDPKKDTRLLGTGAAVLSDLQGQDDSRAFAAKGTYNAKKDFSNVKLVSVEKGSKVQLKKVEVVGGVITESSLKYKVMGQSGVVPSHP